MLWHAARTALAATATLLLTQLLGLPYGYWAVISTIIVMQSSLGGSILAGVRRVVGTTLGAFVGILVLLLLSPSWWVMGLSIFLTLALATLATRAQETFRMAGVTLVVILLVWPGHGSVLWFGLERCMEILIGVGVALLFSLLMWPNRAGNRLRQELAEETRGLANWLQVAVRRFLSGDEDDEHSRVDLLADRLRSSRELHELAVQEAILMRGGGAEYLIALGTLERIFGLIRGLNRIAAVTPSDGYQQRLEGEITSLATECVAFMNTLADRIQPGAQTQHARPSRLPVAVETMEDRLHELRDERATAKYPLMDVANVFAFVQTLKSLAVELEWLSLKW